VTLREKRKFIRDLMENVFVEMRTKAAQMPEEWNGIELRQLLADKFNHETCPHLLTGRRKRDYRNEVIVRNL
jgi:hypothetical protein